MLKRINECFCTILAICLLLIVAGSSAYAATYNSATGELFLPAVYDGEKTYTDVILKLNGNGTYSFVQKTEISEPFHCTNSFNSSTLELITDQMSVSDISSVLGCNWSTIFTFISSSNGEENVSKGYGWADNQCAGIDISFDSNGIIQSKSLGFTSNCMLIPNNNLIYDMTRERFIIQDVIVDDVFISPVTILQFDVQNKTWSLISAEIVDRGEPFYLCNQFKEDTLTKLQAFDDIYEIESFLGCKWSEMSDDSWFFRDHECGMINISLSPSFSSKSFFYKKTGCGS